MSYKLITPANICAAAVLSLSLATVSANDLSNGLKLQMLHSSIANSRITSTGQIADATEPAKTKLQNDYVAFLKEEGFMPKVDSDGDVCFKCEGATYVIFVNEKDPKFFKMGRLFFWRIENEEERTNAYVAANNASRNTKMAKVFVVKDNVFATTSTFVASPGEISPVFKRSLSIDQTSVREFGKEMRVLNE